MRRFNPYKTFIGAWLPNALLKQSCISPGAKIAWARLAQYAGQRGFCYPKQTTMAEELGCNKKTISKYIGELVREGFIEIAKPEGKDKMAGRSSRYYFLAHPSLEMNPAEDHTGGLTEDHTGGPSEDHTGGPREDHTGGPKENHRKENHKKESHGNVARPLADAQVESPVKSKNSNTNMDEVAKTKSKPKRKTAQQRKEEAIQSYESYREYMKIDTLREKPVEQWDAKDFVIFMACGVAKHNFQANLSVKLPFWGRETKTLERCMQAYGRVRLKEIIKTLCLKKADIEAHMGKELKLDISALNSQWVLDCAEKVMTDKPVEKKGLTFQEKNRLKLQASALQKKRAEELRKKLQERKNV